MNLTFPDFLPQGGGSHEGPKVFSAGTGGGRAADPLLLPVLSPDRRSVWRVAVPHYEDQHKSPDPVRPKSNGIRTRLRVDDSTRESPLANPY
jgi:hypothetical protein